METETPKKTNSTQSGVVGLHVRIKITNTGEYIPLQSDAIVLCSILYPLSYCDFLSTSRFIM